MSSIVKAVDLYRLRYPLSCWLVGSEEEWKGGRMEDGRTGRREIECRSDLLVATLCRESQRRDGTGAVPYI